MKCISVIATLLIGCFIFALAGANGAAQASESKVPSGDKRSLTFPDRSIGRLYLLPSAAQGRLYSRAKEIALAQGNVVIEVLPGRELILSANGALMQHPELLDRLPPDALEGVILKQISLEDSNKQGSNNIAHLVRMTGLKRVSLSYLEPTDSAVSRLTALNKLETFSCPYGQLSGSFLKEFKKLPKLRLLDLSFNPLTLENFQQLPTFPKLEFLYLHHCNIDLAKSKVLSRCTNLKELSVSSNKQFDDQCLKLLCHMPFLVHLEIDRTAATMQGYLQLKALKRLQTLRLTDSNLSASDLKQLKAALPNVHMIFQNETTRIDEDTKSIFAPLK